MKKYIYLLFAVLLAATSLSLTSCSNDDEGGDSPLVGTWTRQIQWAGTSGTRDHSYTFNSNGRGRHKYWNYFSQKYVYQNLTWSASDIRLTIHLEKNGDNDASTTTYILSSNSLTLTSSYDTNVYYKE